MKWHLLILFGVLLGTAPLQETPTPPPVEPVRFPTVKTDPVPLPPTPVPPAPVTNLQMDEWYVVETDIPCIVLTSREGYLQITKESGPLRLRGKFVDGEGVQTRQYLSKHVFLIEGIKQGQAELLIIPVGASDESSVLRKTLTVMGVGPQPPPDPDVDPEPDPEPDPDPVPTPPTGIRVLLLYNENAGRDQLNTVNSTEIVQWMDNNCTKAQDGRAEWRRWDRTAISQDGALDREDPIWKKLWDDVKSKVTEDNMVIIAADTKVQLHSMKGPSETLELLKRVKEGK